MSRESEFKTRLVDKTLLITSLVCMLPMVFSTIIYQELPEQVAIHWGSDGQPDGWAPRFLAAFGIPLFLTAINLICQVSLNNDPKRKGHSKIAEQLGKWCVPVVSVILLPVTLLIAMGAEIPIHLLVSGLVGVLLIAVGNYLPKSRQNYTIGIKLPWTLHDQDNWNKTHRLAGYLWMLGGGAFLVTSFMGVYWLMGGIICSIAVIPAVYSFLLYRKSQM